MLNKSLILHIAIFALGFFLISRILHFLGFGTVLLLCLLLGAWYVVSKRPDVIESVKTSVKRRLPGGSAGMRREGGHGRDATSAQEDHMSSPLTHDERDNFNQMVRGWHEDGDETSASR